jgi:hypothetical protein
MPKTQKRNPSLTFRVVISANAQLQKHHAPLFLSLLSLKCGLSSSLNRRQ